MSQIIFTGIFADDIRQEINGKYTLVGCYGTNLHVPSFPARLKGLCFSFNLLIPLDLSKDILKTTFIIKMNGKTLVDLNFDIGQLVADNRIPYFSFSGGMDLPVDEAITQETLLETEAHINGSRFEGPSLIIEKTPE